MCAIVRLCINLYTIARQVAIVVYLVKSEPKHNTETIGKLVKNREGGGGQTYGHNAENDNEQYKFIIISQITGLKKRTNTLKGEGWGASDPSEPP